MARRVAERTAKKSAGGKTKARRSASENITTAWLKPGSSSAGTDHLGTMAIAGSLVAGLLPGITVTARRARLYSFYPWLLWAIDHSNWGRSPERVVDAVRRAECLLCLIGLAHESRDELWGSAVHGGGIAGRDALKEAWEILQGGGQIDLATYASREEGPGFRPYYGQALGGLGQFYLGTLRDLGLMSGSAREGLAYTASRGKLLAEALASHVDGGKFIETLEKGVVTRRLVERLASFCPCSVRSHDRERDLLVQLFFNRRGGPFFEEPGEARRLTLVLLLDLADRLASTQVAGEQGLDQRRFRYATYSGSLRASTPWPLPAALEEHRNLWATYWFVELFSIARQGGFAALLGELRTSGARLDGTEGVQTWFPAQIPPERRGPKTFAEAVAATRSGLPPIDEWETPGHELALADRILAAGSEIEDRKSRKELLKAAEDLLLALIARGEDTPGNGEGRTLDSSAASGHAATPEGLRALAYEKWAGMSMSGWRGWLASQWGLATHLRVALRKLRHERLDTFRVRPTENGLEVVDVPEPVATSPRFWSAFSVLRDLGAIEVQHEDTLTVVTPRGRKLLEEGRG